MSEVLNKRKKIVVVAAVALASIVAGYFGLQYVERRMQSDRSWMPPQIQIRKQSQMLGADRNAAVIPDSGLGFTFPPNLTQEVETLDFTFTRAFDAHGFPNAIPWPDKANILFVGDSILLGEGVGVNKGLVALVDDRLPELVALNLSLPGAGLSRQNQLLLRYGEELGPDLIVACLLISYDFLNDVHFNAWLEDPMGKTYNDFRLSYNRRVNRGSTNRFVRRIQRKAIYNWLLGKVESALPGDGRVRHHDKMPDGQTVLFGRDKVHFAKRIFLESDKEIVQLGGALDQLTSISEDLNAQLVVMLLPSKEELFAVPAGEPSGNALELTMKLLNERGIEYLDLYGPLKSSAERRTPYFSADIHFNEFGNEVVAVTFLDWLLQNRQDNLAGERAFDAR